MVLARRVSGAILSPLTAPLLKIFVKKLPPSNVLVPIKPVLVLRDCNSRVKSVENPINPVDIDEIKLNCDSVTRLFICCEPNVVARMAAPTTWFVETKLAFYSLCVYSVICVRMLERAFACISNALITEVDTELALTPYANKELPSY